MVPLTQSRWDKTDIIQGQFRDADWNNLYRNIVQTVQNELPGATVPGDLVQGILEGGV